MKNISLFTKTLLIIIILFSSSYPQIKFDVKTLMDEKIQLRFIKLAVINNLKNSNWAKIVEFGEDYSLWLTDLERYDLGDSIKSEFIIELRTPSMINRGKLLQIKHISVTYDTSGIYQVNENDDTLITNLLVQSLQSTKIYTDVIKLFTSSMPFIETIIQNFISDFIKEFNRVPTPLEQLEANLLATKVVVELYGMIQNFN
jgi:hypothetical protein